MARWRGPVKVFSVVPLPWGRRSGVIAAALAVLAAAVGAWSIPASAAAQRAGDPYPQVLFDGQNRVNPGERILSVSNVSRLTHSWVHSTGTGETIASPVVAGGMVFEGVYVCCGENPSWIDALNAATGKVVWQFPTPVAITAAAAVAQGTVFVGDYAGTLYALNEWTGKLKWSGPSPGRQFFDSSNLTTFGSQVYAVTDVPGLANQAELEVWDMAGCAAATCTPQWTAPIAGNAQGGAAVTSTNIYVAAGNGQLYAFSRFGCGHQQCSPSWIGQFSSGAGDDPNGSLAVAGNVVYVANGNGAAVDAFHSSGCGSPTCKPLWAYHAPGINTPAGIAIVGDRLFAAAGPSLDAFRLSCKIGSVCQPIWRDTGAGGGHILEANGVIYGAGHAILFADEAANGSRLWTVRTGGSDTAPTVANGTAYFTVLADDTVLAYHAKAAPSPPPTTRPPTHSPTSAPGPTLPATGQRTPALPILVIALLLVVAGVGLTGIGRMRKH